jgi:hypothetical protein
MIFSDTTHKELGKIVWYTSMIAGATWWLSGEFADLRQEVALIKQEVEYLRSGQLKVGSQNNIPPLTDTDNKESLHLFEAILNDDDYLDPSDNDGEI